MSTVCASHNTLCQYLEVDTNECTKETLCILQITYTPKEVHMCKLSGAPIRNDWCTSPLCKYKDECRYHIPF